MTEEIEQMLGQQEAPETWKMVLLIIVVVALGASVMCMTNQDNKRWDAIGEKFCEDRGYDFSRMGGEYIDCETTNATTGIVTDYDFHIDKGIIEAQYGGDDIP